MNQINQINMPPVEEMNTPTQKLIGSNQFTNFKSIEEIKEKIKTFMLETTHSNGFEDWSQRGDIHHIQVYKYILEVTGVNSLFTVSIYTDTMTIRHGGSLWNQFEACLDELSDYLCEEYNLQKYENNMKDDLQKYESILQDLIIIDHEFVSFETYENAKEALFNVVCDEDDIVIEIKDSFLITQQNARYCFVLNSVMNDPTLFKLYIYAHKDEVATKYMKRKLEECVDFMLVSTQEDMIKYYEEEDFGNNGICVTCGKINYTQPVCESEGRHRMVCLDCIEIGHSCEECDTFTTDKLYCNVEKDKHLCFDCRFKEHLLTKQQKPLWAHLLTIVEIQRLSKEHFNVLADYAALCKFTIFDAYRYKSQSHFRNINCECL
jgi:hypothetical protein